MTPLSLRRRSPRRLCWSLAGLLAGLAIGGAASATTPPPQTTLRLSVVVMRHGVRSPTKANDHLDPYAHQAWPQWPVAPGRITAHGDEGLVALGARYRVLLAPALGIANGCAGLAQLGIVADSDDRNHASARALGQGLAPACNMHYQALPIDVPNPLFGDADAKAPATPLSADTRARLQQLQAVLADCQAKDCRDAASRVAKPLFLPGELNDPQAAAKALKTAGGLAENLMLEYAEGFPPAQVGWGRLDRAGVEQLIALHNASFAHTKRPLPAAAAHGSNLLAHVLATLQRAGGQTPAVAPLADAQTRLLLVVGHDTNLANLGGLLDVDWHRADRPDDYPPGGALVFDLLEQGGTPMLRVRTLMPGLQALRDNRFEGDALASSVLPLPPCQGRSLCPLSTVMAWLQPRLQTAHMQQGLPLMQAWPVRTGRDTGGRPQAIH